MILTKRIIFALVFIYTLINCSSDPDCRSSNICPTLQNQSAEAIIPIVDNFLENCIDGSEESDLQPLADWLQTQSCIEGAEVRQLCLYSNPAICFIDLVLPNQDSIALVIEMSRPARVKYLE